MKETIDVMLAAEAAYKELVLLADNLYGLAEKMKESGDAISAAYANDVLDIFEDAEVAAGELSLVIHETIEVEA